MEWYQRWDPGGETGRPSENAAHEVGDQCHAVCGGHRRSMADAPQGVQRLCLLSPRWNLEAASWPTSSPGSPPGRATEASNGWSTGQSMRQSGSPSRHAWFRCRQECDRPQTSHPGRSDRVTNGCRDHCGFGLRCSRGDVAPSEPGRGLEEASPQGSIERIAVVCGNG
jgi:hypothetical protein